MNNKSPVDFILLLKTKIYQRTLWIAALVIVIVWGLQIAAGAPEGYGPFIFPFFLIFCLASLILFKIYGLRYLPPFEHISFGCLFGYFVLQFVYEIQTGLGAAELGFQKFLLWIAVLYTIAFLMFPLRRAVQWSLAFLACILVLGVVYIVAKCGATGINQDLQLLAQIYGSGLAYVSLLYAIARLKEKYTEAEIRSEMMGSLANLDALTGAFSRVKIEELLDYYIANIHIHQLPLSVMVLDLDKLKLINDTYGHDAGDYVLKRIVRLLQGKLREDDALGRIGGDEFLLVCPNTNLDQASILCRRLDKIISEAHFERVGHPSISIGAATYQDGDNAQSLIKRADTHMYQHKGQKKSGKVPG